MAKKKISKKPSKKGLKQKQKQSQSVVVNINTSKARAKRTAPQPAYRQLPQYITLQSDPSPPIIYNTPAVNLPPFESVRTPVKTANEIGIQSTFPETVFIKANRPSKIPFPVTTPNRDAVVNLENIYKESETPIARRTRTRHPLTPDEVEIRRLQRNENQRLRRLKNKSVG